jgi:hypothetical protein
LYLVTGVQTCALPIWSIGKPKKGRPQPFKEISFSR